MNEAETLVRLGEAHQAAGGSCAAVGAWREALAIFDDLGHPDADKLRVKAAG